jgi:hypothetical protein
MQAVEAELTGARDRPDGTGGEQLTYRELARHAYSVEEPSTTQIAAVRRAAGRLEQMGRAETHRVRRSDPFQRRTPRNSRWESLPVFGGHEGAASRPSTEAEQEARQRQGALARLKCLVLLNALRGLDREEQAELVTLAREADAGGYLTDAAA